MRISALINRLNEAKKEVGDIELIFSSDEEGNVFSEDCYFDKVGRKLCLFPMGVIDEE